MNYIHSKVTESLPKSGRRPTEAGGDLASQWGALSEKLEVAAAEADEGSLVVGGASKIEAEGKKKSKDFKDKRAKHYNEFQRVKEMRERLARGELEEDEEGDE